MNFLYRVQTAMGECEALGMFNWYVQVAIVVYNTLSTPIMGSGSMWGGPRVRPEGPRGPWILTYFGLSWSTMVD